jgi:hypothetical protein
VHLKPERIIRIYIRFKILVFNITRRRLKIKHPPKKKILGGKQAINNLFPKETKPPGSGTTKETMRIVMYNKGENLQGRRCRYRGAPSPPSPGIPWPSAASSRSPANKMKH